MKRDVRCVVQALKNLERLKNYRNEIGEIIIWFSYNIYVLLFRTVDNNLSTVLKSTGKQNVTILF